MGPHFSLLVQVPDFLEILVLHHLSLKPPKLRQAEVYLAPVSLATQLLHPQDHFLVFPQEVSLETLIIVCLEICSKRLMGIKKEKRIVAMMKMQGRDQEVPLLTQARPHLTVKEKNLRFKAKL